MNQNRTRLSALSRLSVLLCVLAVLGTVVSAGAAERWPSSELLFPCFEVRLDDSRTSLFAVVNSGSDRVNFEVAVLSDWGLEIPELTTWITLDPNAVFVANLADWVLRGQVPNHPPLTSDQIEHVQNALCGEPSADLYYGTAVDLIEPLRAVGSIVVRADERTQDVLWGDFFIVDPSESAAQGEVLANLDPQVLPGYEDDDDLCRVHGFRFMEGGGFNGGTEFMIWNASSGGSSRTASYPGDPVPATIYAYDQKGNLRATVYRDLEPLQMYSIAELGLPNSFGWLKVATGDVETFIAVRYTALDQFSVMMETFCLPQAGIDDCLILEKWTNGEDADDPPGPTIPAGSTVEWRYDVLNTCNVLLSEIEVTDSHPDVDPECESEVLDPGESMVCLAESEAICGAYSNMGYVTALTPDNALLQDSDPSHYLGDCEQSIDIEKHTNGEDADSPPGPTFTCGDPVEWTYIVTNTGEVPLADVSVTDDMIGPISCPQSELEPDEEMICEATGTVLAGQYANVANVVGQGPEGASSDSDPSHYFGDCPVGIDIEKHTNGEDADAPPGPVVGCEIVHWTYIVMNIGEVRLTDITVTDDQIGPILCPESELEPAEVMECVTEGDAQLGQYANVATVTGQGPEGEVGDSDPSHYFGDCRGRIEIEKHTNGEDADQPPGPTVICGGPVEWTYYVMNVGELPLTDVIVTDDRIGTISCPQSGLEPGEEMICSANGSSQEGQYENVAQAVAQDPAGRPVEDFDPSHYFGLFYHPSIDIEKSTNGYDSDEPPGREIKVTHPVGWDYTVENTGDVVLTDVIVSDDRIDAISCPKDELVPGERMICEALGEAQEGQYANLGTVTAQSPCGEVSDSDPSHYYGVPCGDEGCTPGYWKNHTDQWVDYVPTQSVESVFSAASAYPDIAAATLLAALDFSGGAGLEGAARILLRAGVAAALNCGHSGVDYPWKTPQVLNSCNAALAGGDRDAMLSLAAEIDAMNNLGCPL